MTITPHVARSALFAALLAVSLSGAAAPPSGFDAPDGPDDAGPHGFGPPGPGAPGPGRPFGHLRGLQLSEAQQDKLFAIMHAQAPQRREQDKAIRKAQEGLRELGRAERFDDAKAVALSRELGQALAAEALLRARTEAQVRAVLTLEQRERLRQRRPHGPGRDRGPEQQERGGAAPQGRE